MGRYFGSNKSSVGIALTFNSVMPPLALPGPRKIRIQLFSPIYFKVF